MTGSKSLLTANFINTGAPAAVGMVDESTQLADIVKTMTFTGANVIATSDAVGNVTVEVKTQSTVDIVDGGNF